jgi:hypothetical protein
VLDRIRRVNGDPHFLYRIDKAVLFGLYITGSEDRLKGLDLAIQLAPKEQDPARLVACRSQIVTTDAVGDV